MEETVMTQVVFPKEIDEIIKKIADEQGKNKRDTILDLVKRGIKSFEERKVEKLVLDGNLKSLLEEVREKKETEMEGFNISIQGLAKLLLKQALQAELARQAESEADLILKAKPIEGGEGDEEKEG